MVKLLGFLTVLFFTISAMFFVFLTRFNEESRRVALMSKVAGVMTNKIGGQTGRSVPTIKMEITIIPEPTEEPTPTATPKKLLEIKLGEMKFLEKMIVVKAVKEEEQVPSSNFKVPNEKEKIPWQVFDLQLNFPETVKPGSSDNKFIFQNKEYEIKILNKKGDVLNFFMYKINGDSIIINPESGIWSGDAEYAVGIYSDGAKVSEVKFVVE
jgi:hypothetical protein